jgi:septin family protein
MDEWYYETIITKLCEILSIMDTKEVMTEIHNNNQLAGLYFVLNSARYNFQKLQNEDKTRTNETPQYQPHKFGRSGFYKNVDETESEIQQPPSSDWEKYYRIHENQRQLSLSNSQMHDEIEELKKEIQTIQKALQRQEKEDGQ